MQLTYDGEGGQIYAQLDDNDIRQLLLTHRIENEQGFLTVHQGDGEEVAPLRDLQSPSKLLGISVSRELMLHFLDSKVNHLVHRMGNMLSCELIRITC